MSHNTTNITAVPEHLPGFLFHQEETFKMEVFQPKDKSQKFSPRSELRSATMLEQYLQWKYLLLTDQD